MKRKRNKNTKLKATTIDFMPRDIYCNMEKNYYINDQVHARTFASASRCTRVKSVASLHVACSNNLPLFWHWTDSEQHIVSVFGVWAGIRSIGFYLMQ